MRAQREYNGFEIIAETNNSTVEGYAASVTLMRDGAVQRKFDLPLCEELASEDEALREAVQYGADLVDGLCPWFDPQSSR